MIVLTSKSSPGRGDEEAEAGVGTLPFLQVGVYFSSVTSFLFLVLSFSVSDSAC